MSLFASQRDKGPFIHTQRLVHLVAPPELRQTCLEPALFRARRRKVKGEDIPESGYLLPHGCDWADVNDRDEFLRGDVLGKPNASGGVRERLCLLIDAGVGKTTAMQQACYLRNVPGGGHLALGFRFADLPDDPDDFLDEHGRRFLVREFRTSSGTASVARDLTHNLILRKIREGKFTLLVDALDQSKTLNRKTPQDVAAALKDFLLRHPDVRCIVSGRPYAIQSYWDSLFSAEDWEYAQVDVFTKEEQQQYVGGDRWEHLQRVGADVIAIPRMLETVRGLRPAELTGVRTASDLYWRAVHDLLQQAFHGQDVPIKRPEAEKLFAVLAFEMLRDKNYDGVAADRVSEFIDKVWHYRADELRPEVKVKDAVGLEERLSALAKLNEVIEFAELEDSGELQIYFRDRTLQDFFAALWVTRYARHGSGGRSTDPSVYADRETDHAWLRSNVHLHGEWKDHHQGKQHYQFWKLATEMPAASHGVPTARKDAIWLAMAAVLFLRNPKTGSATRSTEMMYRSWPTLLSLAGYESAATRDEDVVQSTTVQAQRKVRGNVDSDVVRLHCEAGLSADVESAAQYVVGEFLGEFPSILKGTYVPNREAALGWFTGERPPREIVADFNAVCDRPGDRADPRWFVELAGGRYYWYGHACEYLMKQSFQLTKFAVTNELYALFDPEHPKRFEKAYMKYSATARSPAIYLTWYDAWCVSTWLHGRLPNELEWEYACRAQRWALGAERQRETDYGFEGGQPQLAEYAWYDENSGDQTHPVGEKLANAFGLYDMHGNVWEWTSSLYSAGSSGRVLRGGSWLNVAILCPSAHRSYGDPDNSRNNVGVRVVR